MKKFLKLWLNAIVVFIAINIYNFSVCAYSHTYNTRSANTQETIEIVAYIVSAIIVGIIFGCLTNSVIHGKGYDVNWFWLGFFFGFIPLIVALCQPQCEPEHRELTRAEKESKGYWQCSFCYTMNPPYYSECTQCGKTSAESAKQKQVKQQDEAEFNNIQKLKEYKSLLDSGIITQEEFDKKKAEILNTKN